LGYRHHTPRLLFDIPPRQNPRSDTGDHQYGRYDSTFMLTFPSYPQNHLREKAYY